MCFLSDDLVRLGRQSNAGKDSSYMARKAKLCDASADLWTTNTSQMKARVSIVSDRIYHMVKEFSDIISANDVSISKLEEEVV